MKNFESSGAFVEKLENDNEAEKDFISKLTDEEVASGVEYSHIMLKPEAFLADPAITNEVVSIIVRACEENGLDIMAMFRADIGRETVDEIYRKEIDAGIIPDWELARFSEGRTGHIIVRGKFATEVTSKIKGKFTCDNCDKCWEEGNLQIDPHIVSSSKPPLPDWGSGCGIRGMLARKNIVSPDPNEINGTVYNWIHAPDSGEDWSVQPAIDIFNHRKDRVYPFEV